MTPHLLTCVGTEAVTVGLNLPKLDDETSALVRPTLEAFAERLGSKELRLDLACVEVVTSAALAMFIALGRRVKVTHGRLVLLNVSDELRALLQLTRLDTLLEMQERRPAGDRALRRPA